MHDEVLHVLLKDDSLNIVLLFVAPLLTTGMSRKGVRKVLVAKESDAPGPEGDEQMEVDAQAQHGAESGVPRVTTEESGVPGVTTEVLHVTSGGHVTVVYTPCWRSRRSDSRLSSIFVIYIDTPVYYNSNCCVLYLMPVAYSACGCTNRRGVKPGLPFYRFPADSDP